MLARHPFGCGLVGKSMDMIRLRSIAVNLLPMVCYYVIIAVTIWEAVPAPNEPELGKESNG